MPTHRESGAAQDAAESAQPRRQASRVVAQFRYDGPEVLQLTVQPRPEPAAGEVLGRVHAASVNARDCT